jgi:anti-anti-sigma factor
VLGELVQRSDGYEKEERMETNFKVEITNCPEFDCFTFHGNIDIHASKYFQALPDNVVNVKVKLDFSQVGRINSMGIALLLRCCKKVKVEKKAEILLTGVNTMHTMLFKTTGVFLLAAIEK